MKIWRTVCSAKVAHEKLSEITMILLKSNQPIGALQIIEGDYERLWNFCEWLKDWIDTELCDIDDAEIIRAQMEKYNIVEGRHDG